MKVDEIYELLKRMPEHEQNAVLDMALKSTSTMRFTPNIGPQTKAYESPADELFYGGAAGGGKTALICGLAIQEHDKSLILRRTYPQLTGIFDECERILGTREGLREQKKVWVLANNRRIDFGSVVHEKDREDFQGRPHDLIAFDELTQFTEPMYNYIIRWNRHANPDQRCRVVATGNPPMSSEGMWVLKYWGPWLNPNHPNPAEDGELRYFTHVNGVEIECDGPDHIPEGALDPPRSRTFIKAKLEDNPDYMKSGYASVLAAMPEPMRTMLREGRFDIETVDGEWQVIPTAWIIAAQNRWTGNPARHYAMTALGVDVAQGGKDTTVLAGLRDTYFDELRVFKGKDTPDGPAVAQRVLDCIESQALVVIDAGGGYGGDSITQLNQAGMNVRGFVSTEAAPNVMTRDNMHKFYNMRAYAYWKFREALDPNYGSNVALPPDHELLTQLAAPTYEIEPRGIKIESKVDLKARLGVSPDKADAVIIAWAHNLKNLRKTRKNRQYRSDSETPRQRRALTSRQRMKYTRYSR